MTVFVHALMRDQRFHGRCQWPKKFGDNWDRESFNMRYL